MGINFEREDQKILFLVILKYILVKYIYPKYKDNNNKLSDNKVNIINDIFTRMYNNLKSPKGVSFEEEFKECLILNGILVRHDSRSNPDEYGTKIFADKIVKDAINIYNEKDRNIEEDNIVNIRLYNTRDLVPINLATNYRNQINYKESRLPQLPQLPTIIEGGQTYKKTDQKKTIAGRERVIYVNSRRKQFIKMKGEFVAVSSLRP